MEHICSNCDAAPVMEHGKRDITHTYRGSAVVVKDVSGWHCPACHEVVFDEGEGARFSADVRAQRAQVDAEERRLIKTIRKRLRLTQQQAADIFGGGPSAFSKYENGVIQPSKSTMALLLLLNDHPELLGEVQARALTLNDSHVALEAA